MSRKVIFHVKIKSDVTLVLEHLETFKKNEIEGFDLYFYNIQ